ncbi:MAG TPA: HEAT repeat domain-containing protein [Candidatus Limiplasma sp.]|nr:HEAT repeat domain-containing protein [Candidatus Limiplasma sp.]HRX09271.1 HEAT repeat domain-containing protein [Candidatus Limiplasma sp.]
MFGNKMNAVDKAIKKQNVSALIDLSQDKDEEVCLKALAGLGTVGGDDATHYLNTRLQSPDPKVRLVVVQALGSIADKHTKAFLAAQLKREEDPVVKEALLDAMGKIKEY